MPPGMLDGLETVNQLTDWMLQSRERTGIRGRPDDSGAIAGAGR